VASSHSIDWVSQPQNASTREAMRAGKALRSRASRSQHAVWHPQAGRDPLDVLRQSDAGRLPNLLPIRYGRMLQNPFSFYRGAAAIMASDLAATPVSGIQTRICGDAHLMNFGGFGTPEGRWIFDVNDFDETTLGAWEWDIKRLLTSIVIAGRYLKLRRAETRATTARCARSYREHIQEYARMHVLDVWYSRLNEKQLMRILQSAQERRQFADSIHAAQSDTVSHAFPHFKPDSTGVMKIVDQPPLLYHPDDSAAFMQTVSDAFKKYAATLTEDRRALFQRFRLLDAAYKVVGVGSVGTRCFVALFAAGEPADLLVLQMKEARESVFQTYAGARRFKSEGLRVVIGERALQAASDLFLGYATAGDGHDYYVRQLRNMKTSADVDRMSAEALGDYAEFCGWALARAHAKASGSAAMIAGYLGPSATFDQALLEFAQAYAAQNEEDYHMLVDAVHAGKIQAS
jgi:uncharacterized protein (DUF2252 family)